MPKKISFPLANVFRLLEPAPVIMVTTQHKGTPNIMTMAWYTMVDFEPPLVACVMGAGDFSFAALKKTKQCVINIPTVELIEKVVGVGKCSGADVDKFKKFRFSVTPGSVVDVPMINECYANLECKVVDARLAQKYNIFLVEVVAAWVTTSKKRPRTFHHWGEGVFVVDGAIIKLPFKSR